MPTSSLKTDAMGLVPIDAYLQFQDRCDGPCPHCDCRFSRSDALKRHLRVEEERIRKQASIEQCIIDR